MLLRHLMKDSAIYGGADFFSKLVAFLTFPFIAAALSPQAFGAFELIVTATVLLGMIANCGLNNSLQRFYWDEETPASQRPVLVSTGFAILLGLSLFALLVGMGGVAISYAWLSEWIMPVTMVGIVAALVLMVANQLNQYLLDVIRLHMAPWRFLVTSLFARVLTAFAGLGAVVALGWGIDGLLLAQLGVALLTIPVAIALVRKDVTLRLSRQAGSKLIGFGYPFIYAGIAFWLFSSMDRWMLAAMSSVEEVGIYSVAVRFSLLVMFLSTAFGQAWSPWAMKIRLERPDGYRAVYADVLITLASAVLIVGGGLALFAGELTSLLPAEYAGAAMPLAVLSLGLVMQTTQQVTAVGISLEKQTYLFARLSWAAAAINFFLNILLIPAMGALGAALATAAAYLFLTSGYLHFTQQLHPLPISWRRLGVWFSLLTFVAIAAFQLQSQILSLHLILLKCAILLVCAVVGGLLVPWKSYGHSR
jgi:O-antigen/teichoic acid export membrane protein